MGGDDDLVGAERPERVLHRLQRVGVADLAARVDARLGEPGDARVEPPLRSRGGPRRRPSGAGGVERRTDDQDLLVDAFLSSKQLAELFAADGLVGDDEDAALPGSPALDVHAPAARAGRRGSARRRRP